MHMPHLKNKSIDKSITGHVYHMRIRASALVLAWARWGKVLVATNSTLAFV